MTYSGRFTHISGFTRQLQVERKTGKVTLLLLNGGSVTFSLGDEVAIVLGGGTEPECLQVSYYELYRVAEQEDEITILHKQ